MQFIVGANKSDSIVVIASDETLTDGYYKIDVFEKESDSSTIIEKSNKGD